MPWHCPACSTIINHNQVENVPSAGQRYRCHVCRLSLDFDPVKKRLVIADFEADHQVATEAEKANRRLAIFIHDRRKAPRQRTKRK